jgi:hypothetical protein
LIQSPVADSPFHRVSEREARRIIFNVGTGDSKYTFTYRSVICVIKRLNRTQVRFYLRYVLGALLGGIAAIDLTRIMCSLAHHTAGEFEKGDSLEQIYVHIPFLHTSASATGKVKLYDALIPRAILLDN